MEFTLRARHAGRRAYKEAKDAGAPRIAAKIAGNCAKQRANPRAASQSNLESKRRLRAAAFVRLGGAECDACGESDDAALSIDHIWGGGHLERAFKQSHMLYSDLANGRRVPDGLRVLCMSCQFKAKKYGPFVSLWPRRVS